MKNLAFRAVSLAAGLVVALLLVEVALRIAGWPAPGLYVNGAGPLELRNPGRGGGAFPPGVRGELRHYDYKVELISNSYGFRDREITPKRQGEWRIGILGDSFTAGVGVRQQDRFADVFAEAIRKSRPDVTVWNLGAPLCGTACEAEMLNSVKQSYELDEIVLAFCGSNDLEDNNAWHATDQTSRQHAPNAAGRVKDWLRVHSRVATFLWVTSLRAWATFRPEGVYAQDKLDKDWPATERSLNAVREAAGGKRLTVLYLPSPPEWNDSAWQLMRTRYQAADDGRFLVRNAVAEWTRKTNLPFLDATGWLRNCGSQEQCLLPVDPHWTPRGHQLVAQGLVSQGQW